MGNFTGKGIIVGILVILLVGMFAGCGKSETSPIMQMKASSLTDGETNIVKLTQAMARSCQIFDYNVDSKMKSVSVVGYRLDEKGKWVVSTGPTSFSLQDTSGRIAISFGDMLEGLRIGIQQEDGVSSSETQPGQKINGVGMGSSTSFADLAKIQYGQEIPLAIQAYSSANDFTSPEVDDFYHPENLQKNGYDEVFAVAIQFSEKDLK